MHSTFLSRQSSLCPHQFLNTSQRHFPPSTMPQLLAINSDISECVLTLSVLSHYDSKQHLRTVGSSALKQHCKICPILEMMWLHLCSFCLQTDTCPEASARVIEHLRHNLHLKVNIMCRHILFFLWQEFSQILHSWPTRRKSTESQLSREGAVDLAGLDFVKILKSLCSVIPECESINVAAHPASVAGHKEQMWKQRGISSLHITDRKTVLLCSSS